MPALTRSFAAYGASAPFAMNALEDIGELVDLVDGIFVDLVAKALAGNLDAEDLRRARFAVSEFVRDAERQPSTPNTARS